MFACHLYVNFEQTGNLPLWASESGREKDLENYYHFIVLERMIVC